MSNYELILDISTGQAEARVEALQKRADDLGQSISAAEGAGSASVARPNPASANAGSTSAAATSAAQQQATASTAAANAAQRASTAQQQNSTATAAAAASTARLNTAQQQATSSTARSTAATNSATAAQRQATSAAALQARAIDQVEREYLQQAAAARQVLQELPQISTASLTATQRGEALAAVTRQISSLQIDPGSAKASSLRDLALGTAALTQQMKTSLSVMDQVAATARRQEDAFAELVASHNQVIAANARVTSQYPQVAAVALTATQRFEALKQVEMQIARIDLDPNGEKAKDLREIALKSATATQQANAVTAALRQQEQAGGRTGSMWGGFKAKLAEAVPLLAVFTAGLLSIQGAVGLASTGFGDSSEFSRNLTQTHTMVGISREELAGMKQDLLSMDVGKGPVELSAALYTVAGAGARGAEALEIIEQAAYASAMGMGETKTVALTVVSALEAYGRESMTATDATRMLRNAIKEGNAEASQMAPALGNVLGVAAEMGVSLDQVTAWVARLSKTGISASTAVDYLRDTLTGFLRPTEGVSKALKEVGLSAEDVRKSINEKGLAQTLIDLKGLIGDDKEALGKLIPSIQALSGVLAAVGSDGGKSYLDTVAKIKDTTEDLGDVFAGMRATDPGQALVDLKARAEGLSVVFGDGLTKALHQSVLGMGELTTQKEAAAVAGEQVGRALGIVVDGLIFASEHAGILKAVLLTLMALKLASWLGTATAEMWALIGAKKKNVATTIELAAAETSAKTATTGLVAGLTPLAAGLGVALVAVIALNDAMVSWSQRSQADIAAMVRGAHEYAEALRKSRDATEDALKSLDPEFVKRQLDAEAAARDEATAAAERYRLKVEEVANAELALAAKKVALRESGLDFWATKTATAADVENLENLKSQQANWTNELDKSTSAAKRHGEQFHRLLLHYLGLPPVVEEAKTGTGNLSAEQDQLGERIAEATRDMREQIAALSDVGSAYGVSVAYGDKAVSRMQLELSIRQQLRGATEGQIQGQLRLALAVQKAQDAVDTDAAIASLREQTDALYELIGGYAGGLQAGLDYEQTLEDQAALTELLALATGKQVAKVVEAFELWRAARDKLAGDQVEAQLNKENAAMADMLAAYKQGPSAVAALTAEQGRAIEKMRILSGLTQDQRDKLEPLVEKWLDLAAALRVASSIETARQELALMTAKLEVRREDHRTLEQYRLELERVGQQIAINQKIDEATKAGASPAELASLRAYLEAVRSAGKILQEREVETLWQAGVRSMAETLQTSLTDAGTAAIAKWVELGDGWVANLVESLIEAFASAAVQNALSGAFNAWSTGQGGGGNFWGNLANSFMGQGGQGGGGQGGGFDWAGAAGAVSGAWKAWQSGGKFWSTLANGGSAATTAPAYLSSTPPTWATYGNEAWMTNPWAAQGAQGAGMSAATTSMLTAGITAALVYGIQEYAKHQAKDYPAGITTFSYQERTPLDQIRPVAGEPGGPAVGSGTNGGGSGGGLGFDGTALASTIALETAERLAPKMQGYVEATGALGFGNSAAIEGMRQQFESALFGMAEALGGTVVGFDALTVEMNRGGDIFVTTADGVKKTFKTMEEAMAYSTQKMIASADFEGLSENVAAVLARVDSIGLDGLQGALDLAMAADAALAGQLGTTKAAVTEFERQTAALEAELKKATEEGLKYGISLEALNALGQQRREQLQLEQDIAKGNALGSFLSNLAGVMPAMAADAEIAAPIIAAVGQMRIAQLIMEGAKLVENGWLAAEVFARIKDGLLALDPTTAGQGGGGSTGGGSGSTGGDNGVAQREAERWRIRGMVADMAAGLSEVARQARDTAAEIQQQANRMAELSLPQALIDQYRQLAGDEAMRGAGADAREVIQSSGESSIETARRELDTTYADQIEYARALAEQLGRSADATIAEIEQALAIERGHLAEEAVASLGLPLEQTRAAGDALIDTMAYLKRAVAEGSISQERYADVIAQVQQQTAATLFGSAAALLEQAGNTERAMELRSREAEFAWRIQVANLEMMMASAAVAEALSDEAMADLQATLAWIKDPANRPDFSPPPATDPVVPANDNDPIGQTAGEDLVALRRSVLDTLADWRNAVDGDALRSAKAMTTELREVSAEARRAGVSLAEVNSAFGVMADRWVDDRLAQYEALGGTEWDRERDSIRSTFDDLRAAFGELGRPVEDFRRLVRAEAQAMQDLRERAGEGFADLLDRIRQEDPRANRQERYEDTRAEFLSLAERARRGDLDALAQLGEAGDAYRTAAQGYLGRYGSGTADAEIASFEDVLGRSARSTADPIVSEIGKGNLYLAQIARVLGASSSTAQQQVRTTTAAGYANDARPMPVPSTPTFTARVEMDPALRLELAAVRREIADLRSDRKRADEVDRSLEGQRWDADQRQRRALIELGARSAKAGEETAKQTRPGRTQRIGRVAR